MRAHEITLESPADDLAKRLPGLEGHTNTTIHKLMKDVARRHKISDKALHNLFIRKYGRDPLRWNTTEDIAKHEWVREDIFNSKISSLFEQILRKEHGNYTVPFATELQYMLYPEHVALRESQNDDLKTLHDTLVRLSKTCHVPIHVGAKVCLLQTIINVYANEVIMRGFKNPKTITKIEKEPEDDFIKWIEFDDGTRFPEKYEYSSMRDGPDLLTTLFFSARHDLEKIITYISMTIPSGYKMGTKGLMEGKNDSTGRQQQIKTFIQWALKKLNVQKPYPKITLSNNTEKAQSGHHTGLNVPSENTIWVYIGNRNLIDIFRSILHELAHVRQSQLNMIGPDDSYPGSPIELLADMTAGKLIKFYGKEHPEIFE